MFIISPIILASSYPSEMPSIRIRLLVQSGDLRRLDDDVTRDAKDQSLSVITVRHAVQPPAGFFKLHTSPLRSNLILTDPATRICTLSDHDCG